MLKSHYELEKYIEKKFLKSGNDKFLDYLNNKEKIYEIIPNKYKEVKKEDIDNIFLTSSLNYDLEAKFKSENKNYITLNNSSGNIIIFFNYEYAFNHFMLEYKSISLEVKGNEVVVSLLCNIRNGFEELKKINVEEPDIINSLAILIKEKGNEFFNLESCQKSALQRIKEWDDRIISKINKDILKNHYRSSSRISITKKAELFNLEKMHEHHGYIFDVKISDRNIDTSNFSANYPEEKFYEIIEYNVNMEKNKQVAHEEKTKIMGKIKISKDDVLVNSENKKRRL